MVLTTDWHQNFIILSQDKTQAHALWLHSFLHLALKHLITDIFLSAQLITVW